MQYPGVSDLQAHFPDAAGESVGPGIHVTPEAEESHDKEGIYVRVIIRANLLCKALIRYSISGNTNTL